MSIAINQLIASFDHLLGEKGLPSQLEYQEPIELKDIKSVSVYSELANIEFKIEAESFVTPEPLKEKRHSGLSHFAFT
jgi:hypothetical protein